MLMCDKCNRPVRLSKKRLEDGHSVRVCRSCGDEIDR
jgi:RNase P subunit RPR2